MSNWFEENSTKSIISYTLLIIGVTWGAFVFVFDENKENVHKAEVANLQSASNQYKAKVEVLESQIGLLKSENTKLHNWLVNTPKTIPYLEKKIEKLTKENASLKKTTSPSTSTKESSTIPALTFPPLYKKSNIQKGSSFFDPNTLTSVGVNKFNPDFTADIQLTLPGQEPQYLKSVKPGTQWTFEYEGKKYSVILNETNWYTNEAKVSLLEHEGKP